MALLDDLVAQIRDAALRARIEDALADLKRRQRFGLVFEEHIPETTALCGLPVQVGATVQRRDDPAGVLYRVAAVNGRGKATLEPSNGGGEVTEARVSDLLVVKQFGEAIYPALTSVGAVRRGPSSKPHHAVINGENFHALQLLLHLHEGQVDCIYIDPPYNTGATDWKYNNCYVDESDGWRHSKWLSMMDRRLKIARRLLRPDGVLVVTIDENELHHIGMLLERLFPDARRQVVTICMNPSGASGEGLSRVGEYAVFCFLGGTLPVPGPDDMLTEGAESGEKSVEWESLLRRGNAWYRRLRPNLCYPIAIDTKTQRIVGTGEPFSGTDEGSRSKTLSGKHVAWPVRKDGRLGIWRVDAKQLTNLVSRGFAYVSSKDDARGTWTIRYLMKGTIKSIEQGEIAVRGRGDRGEVLLQDTVVRRTVAKTIWHRGRHTAGGAGGTQALAALLGERDRFPYPKSVYAVRDCLASAIGDRKQALILDFFAGSGTTLHATALMNVQDDGTRRCVLVTNNEVSQEATARLREQGHHRGSPEFERHGIFERVTRPRCEAVVSGIRPDGAPVEGEHLEGRPYSEGFDENVEFFRLDYLDPDEVELRRQFDAILPALWLGAGGIGEREHHASARHFSAPAGTTYAVLFREAHFRKFRDALRERPDVTHVYLVTDSETAFAEMRAALPPKLRASMLYRDYLRNFRINSTRTS